jgi:hypothetical protein
MYAVQSVSVRKVTVYGAVKTNSKMNKTGSVIVEARAFRIRSQNFNPTRSTKK